jgi:hypothetical protein
MAAPDDLAVETWAARQCVASALGDARLDGRFADVLAALAARPTDSIPQACGRWGPTKAAYRFFENDRVTTPKLLQPITEATALACGECPVVYAVQDTSSLNFSRARPAAELGPINDSAARGLLLHSTLAVRADGVPLGLLAQRSWARSDEEKTAAKRRARQIDEKESRKWLDGIRDAREALATVPAGQRPRLIHVMDREGDVHEVLAEIVGSGEGAVIRCAQNRKIDGEIDLAHAAVRAAKVLGRDGIEVPRRGSRRARSATVEYRALSVRLRPDPRRRPGRAPLEINLVEVFEPEAPEGVEPLHWRLWTSEPVATLEQARAVAGGYKLRWRIEDVHLSLKSGCRIEALQFETAERLQKAIVLYTAIATRIVRLRDLARRTPEAPCTIELSDDEWRVLWAHRHSELPAPDEPPPTLRQAVRWIGQLGGHLGRKRDGMPGVRTLWRGMRDLQLLVAGYRTARRIE